QERDPIRSESASGRERHPDRHPGHHQPRDARAGDGRHRRIHRPRARLARRRRRARVGAIGSRGPVPDVPAVPGAAQLTSAVSAVFAPDGPIATALPGFEPRGGQLEMAEGVSSVLAEGGVLLAEAGTGTGKTLAYLIPAILSRQRVLVST